MPTTSRSDFIVGNEHFTNRDQSHISKQPKSVRLLKDSRSKSNVTKSLFTPEKENLTENLEYRVKKANILNPMPISGNEPPIKLKSNNYNLYKLVITNDSDRDSTTNANSEQLLDTNKLFNFYNNQLSQQIPIRKVIKSPPSKFEKGATNSATSITLDLICQSLAINKLQLSKSNS